MKKHSIVSAAIYLTVFAIAFAWGALAAAGHWFPHDQAVAVKRYFSPAEIAPAGHEPYWLEKTSFFDSFKTPAAVVMIGDSLTDGAEWREIFPQVNIVNRGIDGDTSAGVLERIDGIVAVNARQAFIMIGVNDFTSANRAVEAVFDNYRRIIATLEQQGTTVYIQSTLLCNAGKAVWTSCSAANEKIKPLNLKLAALASKTVTFIDLNKTLADADGLKSEFTYDGVHLNAAGYRHWMDAIAPLILAGAKR